MNPPAVNTVTQIELTPENQKKYDAKLKRINDAIALKEPDRVPLNPPTELFPIFNAGYTVAEVVYDTSLEKITKAMEKYLLEFDPDTSGGVGMVLAGEGPGMELTRTNSMRWAGMPEHAIPENSLQQHIEFPVLLDDEFDEFWSDRTGWLLRKSLPRQSGLLEPFKAFTPAAVNGVQGLAGIFGSPAFKEMIDEFAKIREFYASYTEKAAKAGQYLSSLGYPSLMGGMAGVPFDAYSDFLRGTMLSMADLYDRPEDIERYIDEQFELQIALLRSMKGINPGKHIFMALHKGMDGFMSDEHYRKYYWKHLQAIIEEIIKSDHVPYIYTEGKYNSRLECLAEVPVGKVYYHFEDVDMAAAKKIVGKVACIAGGFNAAKLDWYEPEKVRDEVKQLLDECAPGGGFIFETGYGLGNCKRENVEAMFETVKEYGKY